MDSSQKLKIGVIGCGHWGMNYLRVFSEIRESQLIGLLEPDAPRVAMALERFPAIRAYREMGALLAEADAVVVATPAATHYAVACQVLEAGKHLLVEKPITLEVGEAEALVALAQARKCVLMVGHTFLFNAGVTALKHYVESAEFGKAYYIHATRTNLGPIRKDVNAVWDLATHDISIANFVLGDEPVSVSAVGARFLGNAREDVAFITLHYPNNVLCNIHVSWADPNKVRRVTVVGSNQRIVFDDLDSLEPIRIFEKGVVPVQAEVDSFGEFKLLMRDGAIRSPKIEASEPLKNLCAHFLKCVALGQTPLTDGRHAVGIIRILKAIERSIQNGSAAEPVESPAASHAR
ncbi:MAG: Gfo/Idh/MocA family oxidoreductase [Acidobacteria bacterium]|nr:Gfo/Idh/MocA family oxidoreductase [Acidobacteriota bacterium]